MRSRGWIATTIGFAILAAACTSETATPSRQQEGPIAVGDEAPAFTLEVGERRPRLAVGLRGQPREHPAG